MLRREHFITSLVVLFLLVVPGCGKKEDPYQKSDENPMGPPGTAGPVGPAGAPGATGESFRDMSRRLLDGVKAYRPGVLNLLCNGASGSGTRISADSVVTAYHVLEGATSCVIRSNGLQVAVGGELIRSQSGRDIGFIRGLQFNVEVPTVPVVKGRTPSVGDLLLLFSYPGDFINDLQTTLGFVTDENAQNSLGDLGLDWRDAIVSDMAAGSGSSGGPIFNDTGEFIGIHVGGFGNGATSGLELNFQLIFQDEDLVNSGLPGT